MKRLSTLAPLLFTVLLLAGCNSMGGMDGGGREDDETMDGGGY